jgi:uncharacterized protein YbjT (DUF2867 family)
MDILLIGATGLVGRECLRLLAATPAIARVVVLARRPLPPAMLAPKVEVRVTDFALLGTAELFPKVDAVLCALGTTIRQAGSPERFREVDYGYPLAVAKLALARGARQFLLVSATGANARSRMLYSRVKGELEAAVSALGFRGVTIARPSFLVGDREEFRLAERILTPIAHLIPGRLRAVKATAVAKVLVDAALADRPGVRVLESEEIRKLEKRV